MNDRHGQLKKRDLPLRILLATAGDAAWSAPVGLKKKFL
jgi:hypothetical protein